ncbi:MAG TPA: RagB/SusD family nutrient uptake outer membrane protein, partial [Longimicrobiales bacterium]|nr:RagB/SusD family nutrient uptake outer membrane protein [Longimicrobiales bacterium]
GCDLDLQDPNNPNEEPIITSPEGLRQVAVGLQAEYGNELVDPVYIAGLVADEIGSPPTAFESYRLVDAGGQITNDLGPSTETWAGQFDVVQVANVLLDNVPLVPTLGPEMSNALTALAKTFKAMAFGNLLQTYERIPLEVGLNNLNPTFATRVEGLNTVLQLLNEARQQLQTTPAPADFTNNVLAPGFDLVNTINAMIARYALIAGDLNQALTAAQRVNLNVLSEFRFSSNDANPLWNLWLNSGNAYQMRPEDRFRTSAQAGDQRVAYWVVEAAVTGSTVPLDNFAKYTVRDASFPAYLPDEMRLIQAEVYARQNNLTQALVLLNQVRTQCTSTLAEPVACLPALTPAQVPTQQAMLDAILRERQYELFVQGVSWSDLRRFGKPMKYSFMSVYSAECTRNSNAPPELCDVTGD